MSDENGAPPPLELVDGPPGGAPNADAPAAAGGPAEDGWRFSDKQQKWYVPRKGRPGIIYREGNESIDEARARDEKGPRDTRPKSKSKAGKGPKIPKAPAPTQVSLKELEFALAEALQSPAMICAATGDGWAADHFTTQGPTLARNLVKAAEHNPWLRAKLEATLAGEEFLIKVMTLMPVGAALIGYALPPVIYFLNPPFVPPQAREMFQVPDRAELKRQRQEEGPDDAAPAAAAEAAETPVAA